MSSFHEELIKLRGGCTCFISAPCSNCFNPVTDDEVDDLLEIADHRLFQATKLEIQLRALREAELFKLFLALRPGSDSNS